MNLRSFTIHLIQHKTHAPLLKMQLSNLSTKVNKTKEAIYLQGELNDVSAWDLTGYPNTRNADSADHVEENDDLNSVPIISKKA